MLLFFSEKNMNVFTAIDRRLFRRYGITTADTNERILICGWKCPSTNASRLALTLCMHAAIFFFIRHIARPGLQHHLGLDARNPDFVACEQQRRRSACASTQSDQRLCHSLSLGQVCRNSLFFVGFNMIKSLATPLFMIFCCHMKTFTINLSSVVVVVFKN